MAGERQGRRVGLLDRLIASAEPAEIRAQLLQTVLQRRPALILSSAAIFLMSLTAAIVTRAPWAIAWAVVDIALLGYRVSLTLRYDRPGEPSPEWLVRRIVRLSLLVFLILGFAAMTLARSGDMLLTAVAALSVVALVSALSSRWAAMPRLAGATIVTVGGLAAGGFATAPEPMLRLATIQLVLIVIGAVLLTRQNHRALLEMLHTRRDNRLMARTDALTGLPNRVRLIELLAERCAGGADFALLYLDLDGFKAVNDAGGHERGDAVLREVGAALAALALPVCRIGGDEFVMLADGDGEAATAAAYRAIKAVGDIGHRLGLSVGIAVAPGDGRDPDTLMSRADRALYAAKSAGRGRIRHWRDDVRRSYGRAAA